MHSDNDLMVQCKANQPGLLEALQTHTVSQPHQDRHVSTERAHGRREYREVRCYRLPEGFGHEPWHRHFRLAIEVMRHTQVPALSLNGWRTRSSETAYYLATCELSAEAAAQAIRQHWHIENRLHHVLDVSLGKDRSRTRRNPGPLARLRRAVLNLLRHNGETQISDALYENGLDIEKVLAYNGL